jgi:ABC-type branched-subunit amino acid transport system substrate-binding protein
MRRPLGLVVLVALATGCGSTVQSTSVVGGGAVPTGDGLSTAPSTTGGTLPVVGGPQAVTGTTGGTVAAGSTGGTGTTTGGVDPVSGPAVSGPAFDGRTGPGVTDKVIYVGIVDAQNADAVNQAAGVGAITHGDSLANARAIVDDINKHGGVAGRKLEIVTAPFDTTSTAPIETQWSAVCQRFTRDKPVFAVLDTGTEAFHDCLAKAGVVQVSSNLAGWGEAEFRSHPGFVELSFPNVDRLARYMTTSLVEQKYFTPWNTFTGQPAATGTVKVGILTYDDKHYAHAVDTILVPALKKLGYSPIVQRIGQVGTAGDYGSQAAAVSSAQLTFAANQVTHVISFESNGGLSTFFMPNARSQNYYPRFGVNTASGSEALMEAGIVDARHFNGAVGVGWIPAVDLRAVDYPENSPYSDEARRHCRAVMRSHGITPDSGNAEAIMLGGCASFYLIQAALKDATRVTLGTFVAAVERLGVYHAAGSLGELFAPGRSHDGLNRAYHWRFVNDCSCFRYEGTLRTIP